MRIQLHKWCAWFFGVPRTHAGLDQRKVLYQEPSAVMLCKKVALPLPSALETAENALILAASEV